MGALTETRKRCFGHLLHPSSPPHPISDRTAIPPSKRPKIQSQFLDTNPPLSSLPPPPTLSRPVHGPQRIIRAFNLGSINSSSIIKRVPLKMGNFVSCFFKSKKEEGFGLEDYRKLVNDSGFRKFDSGLGSRLGLGTVDEIPPVSPGSDGKEVNVLNRKVENARRVVEESVELRDKKVYVRKVPVYKDLLEESKRHDPTLSSLAFEVKLIEEKLSGFRFVAEVQKQKPKEDLYELFRPLTEEEEEEVCHAFCGSNRRKLLVTHNPSNIEITGEVLQCLNGNAWLNDEVINFYLELLKERERREPKKFLKCHFFNTFFYKKLASGRNGYDFNAVKRWTTQRKLGYGLIDCDRIFVPIHKDIHWCLAVINVREETFQYLDSLRGMDTNVLRVLARYLMDEVKDKSHKQIDTNTWKREVVDDLPLQENGWDCGMFMLKYTDFYSRGLGLYFSQRHMSYFRKRTAMEILNAHFPIRPTVFAHQRTMAGALTSCSLPALRPLHRTPKTTKRFRVSAEIKESTSPSSSVKEEEEKSSSSISPPKDFKPPEPKPFGVRPGQSGAISGASIDLFFRLGTGVFAQGYSVTFIPEDKFPAGQYATRMLGYKLKETARLGPQPEKPIEIYEFQSCPFCRKVREIVSILDIDVLFYPCPRNGPNFRPKLLQMGGKQQFPYMVDPNTGVAMYESDEIIKYLVNKYGDGSVPLMLSLGLLTTLTAGLAMIGRMGKGSLYTPSKLPPKPLEVWAYEGSPFCKLVREVLVELELPHIQRSCTRGSPKRQILFERVGHFQAPYLDDPNTGVKMFESADIVEYLRATYALQRA